MTAPKEIIELVERFKRNVNDYKSGKYNETQVRREFVDPMFKALGWDIDNEQGYAEAYKDVIHEAEVIVSGKAKAPDYSFRIGGTRKFFVEAKKPSVFVREDVAPAFQLRRYGWSAKLPLSIVTDFEEFAVYDCRTRPDKTDKASTARIMYVMFQADPKLKIQGYYEAWDEIAGIFSREAILKGSFDRFAEASKGKRGTAEVDSEFLKEIEKWREKLARDIALRNRDLSQGEINYAVQMTIDRLIFLRICEDRGIEPYEQLKDLYQTRGVYERLCDLFRQADDKYNSGLFHFRDEKGRGYADEWTLGLGIDDDTLVTIIRGLYYPNSPYEFSVMPASVLGQVYEQFLGKVITLTKGHKASVEDKPEVKKAGGVYYTPDYIVTYIVKNTVGKLLENKTPDEAAQLRVLDPACGSGSFLIGAYQLLLDWHLGWYMADGAEKHTGALYQVGEGNWRLTTAEKKRILLNNIYGVDIDTQAVEVTKLSLLLKVLEGETHETIGTQMRRSKERALPDLGSNIKCGNSLIGYDFFDGQEVSEEERTRINAFDWASEFPEVTKASGFDAVIGNPPYIDSEWMTRFMPDTRSYCSSRYQAASGNWDIFCVFIEKALILCKQGGFSSFIVPNKLGAATYASGARQILAVENSLLSIRDYSTVPVFPVAVYPIVYVAQQQSPQNGATVIYERVSSLDASLDVSVDIETLDYAQYFANSRQPWAIFSQTGGSSFIARFNTLFPSLDSVAKVLGAATVSEAYEIKTLIAEGSNSGTQLRVINSGTIDRYSTLWGIKPFRYLGASYIRPVITDKGALPNKRREQAEQPKIIIAGMTKNLECTIDTSGTILAGKSTSIVISAIDLNYLAGLMNSKFVDFYYRTIFGANSLQGGYLRVGPPQLKSIPIRTINFSDRADKARHDQMVKLVEKMLDLNNRLAGAKTPQEQTALERQIAATDGEIDRLVYELYGLTDEEIAIVEGG